MATEKTEPQKTTQAEPVEEPAKPFGRVAPNDTVKLTGETAIEKRIAEGEDVWIDPAKLGEDAGQDLSTSEVAKAKVEEIAGEKSKEAGGKFSDEIVNANTNPSIERQSQLKEIAQEDRNPETKGRANDRR